MGKKESYFIHLLTYWFIWQVRRETQLPNPQPTSTTSATLKMLQFISPSLLTRCCCSFGRTLLHRRRNQASQARTADFQHLSSEPNRQKKKKKKAHRSTTVSVVASRNVLTWQQIRPIPVERKLHAFDRRNWKSGQTARREEKKGWRSKSAGVCMGMHMQAVTFVPDRPGAKSDTASDKHLQR